MLQHCRPGEGHRGGSESIERLMAVIEPKAKHLASKLVAICKSNLIASLLLVAMPGAPSSLLLLVAMHFAPSSKHCS